MKQCGNWIQRCVDFLKVLEISQGPKWDENQKHELLTPLVAFDWMKSYSFLSHKSALRQEVF